MGTLAIFQMLKKQLQLFVVGVPDNALLTIATEWGVGPVSSLVLLICLVLSAMVQMYLEGYQQPQDSGKL